MKVAELLQYVKQGIDSGRIQEDTEILAYIQDEDTFMSVDSIGVDSYGKLQINLQPYEPDEDDDSLEWLYSITEDDTTRIYIIEGSLKHIQGIIQDYKKGKIRANTVFDVIEAKLGDNADQVPYEDYKDAVDYTLTV